MNYPPMRIYPPTALDLEITALTLQRQQAAKQQEPRLGLYRAGDTISRSCCRQVMKDFDTTDWEFGNIGQCADGPYRLEYCG